MSFAFAWSRIELRRRSRSLLVLALLVALGTGVVLAAVAGARRGATAVDRLAAVTLAPTVRLDPDREDFDWAAVRRMPEVAGLALTADRITLVPDGLPPDGDYGGWVFLEDDDSRGVARPVLLAGRRADPTRTDEVVVTQPFVELTGRGLGSTITGRFFSLQQLRDGAGGPPAGPRVSTRIVGVVRNLWVSDIQLVDPGVIIPSPAFARRYLEYSFEPDTPRVKALVRLRHGAADLPAFQRRMAQLAPEADSTAIDFPAQQRALARSTTYQGRFLLAFALFAAVATVLLVGQALVRYAATAVTDLSALRGAGLSPRRLVTVAALPPVAAVALGAAAGATGAWGVSGWFPLGTAARFEPEPGLRFDPVLVPGAMAILALGALAAVAAAALTATGSRSLRGRLGRRSAVAGAAARAGLPVPLTTGIRFALERGYGRAAVPVLPALVGAVVGVGGIVAAATVSAGLTEAVGNPARFGTTWQLDSNVGFNGQDYLPAEVMIGAAQQAPGVAGTSEVTVAPATDGDGRPVAMYSYRPRSGEVPVTLTRGRMPERAGEVVLGPASAQQLGARIGDRVTLTGSAGRRELTLVGIGFVPEAPGNDYTTGGWLTADGFAALFKGFQYHGFVVALRPGTDPLAARAGIRSGLPPELADAVTAFNPTQRPRVVTDLEQVRRFPVALGAFLGLLALGAVGHGLATAVRRRRGELAVLRAVGMTGRQSRLVVLTQVGVLAVVGLLLGLPLGLAAGRTVWRLVADATPLQYAPPSAATVALLLVPATVLAGILLALWPARRAARFAVAPVLRTE